MNTEVDGLRPVNYAIAYAHRGFRVFQVHWIYPDGKCSCRRDCGSSGKHPIEKGWQESATTDEQTIIRWWTRNPQANIGVKCGKDSNLTVLDVDGDVGLDTLHDLELKHGELPVAPLAITGRGGNHYYFKYEASLANAVRFAPGLDIRTEGGLVVGVGSQTTGPYLWDASFTLGDNLMPSQMPEWLIRRVHDAQTSKNNGSPRLPDQIREGEGRNHALFKVGRSLKSRGMPESAIRAGMLAANQSVCKPPMEPDEIEKLIENVINQPHSAEFKAKADEQTAQVDDTIESTLAKFNDDPSLALSNDFLDACAVVSAADPARLDRIRRRLKEKHFRNLTEFNRRVLEREHEQKKSQKQANVRQPPSTPHIIETSDQYPVIAGLAFAALRQANTPIVRLVSFNNYVTRVDDDIIESLTVHSLRDELTKAIHWLDYKLNPSKPTVDFAHLLLAGVTPALPKVTRFARSPVFTKDGKLVMTPGLDSTSGIFLLPHGFDLGEIPKKPSDEQVKAARELLLEMVVNFPFATDADKANAIALAFERPMREMIRGPLPLTLFDSTTAGSGKGLLVRSLLGISNTPISAWPEVTDDAELRKALTSFFMQGVEALIIDNVKHRLTSGVLALALTEPVWRDRLLGLNRDIVIKILNSWIMTANNPSYDKDFLRRCSRIRLTPKMEHPENRQPGEFTHPDLPQWCTDNRDRLMRSILILAQNWLATGKPPPKVPLLGSYESWTFVIGGILQSAGIAGFQENRLKFQTDAGDSETEHWRDLIAQWWNLYGDKLVLSKQLYPIAEQIDGFPMYGDNEKAQRASFGKALAKQSEKVYTLTEGDKSISLEIVRLPVDLHSAAQWKLVELKK